MIKKIGYPDWMSNSKDLDRYYAKVIIRYLSIRDRVIYQKLRGTFIDSLRICFLFHSNKATEPNIDSHLENVVNMTEGRVQWWLNRLDKATHRDEYVFITVPYS